MDNNNWISVTDPKEEGYKIVSAPGVLGIYVAYWDGEEWIHPERDTDGARRKITEYVTHWQPLPAPPPK